MRPLREKEQTINLNNFPDNINRFLETIHYCAKKNGHKLFLYGDFALYKITGNSNFLKTQKNIKIILSFNSNFNQQEFYQCLTEHINITKETESSSTKYSFISSFNVEIDLIQNFDPINLNQAKQFGRFNFDVNFYNLDTNVFISPLFLSDTSVLKNVNSDWIFEDVLGFVLWAGNLPEIHIDNEQYKKLRLLSLGTLKESLDVTWLEQIENILLLRYSGAALRFIANTFADGKTWIFKVLVDYMIFMSVGVNDESDIDTVFNEKKYALIDLYNDFFLEDKTKEETSEDIQHRLTMILKILFDSPNLDIPRPYINKIRAMSGGILGRCCLGTSVGGNISFFGCGNDIEEEDCLGFPVNCTDNNLCLREHDSFTHIPFINWDLISVDFREWCPGQVCPDVNNIHCQPGP